MNFILTVEFSGRWDIVCYQVIIDVSEQLDTSPLWYQNDTQRHSYGCFAK
jgi:hypothetical protein